MRDFAGIDQSRESVPHATTLLKFRRLLVTNGVTKALFEEINAHLASPARFAHTAWHHRGRHHHRCAQFDAERKR